MRFEHLNLLVALAISLSVTGCGDQPEAAASNPINNPAWTSIADIAKPTWASTMGKDQYGTWADLTVKGVTQRFRMISAGTFTMGDPVNVPPQSTNVNDAGIHIVTLTRDFWLGDSTCTQELCKSVIPPFEESHFKGDPLRPLESVSWNDCQYIIQKLNRLIPGAHFRLPTDAEWEYACRAGTTGPYYDTSLDSIAWFKGNSGSTTHPVKKKSPNAWGLYDMLGNVWQWCEDFYEEPSTGHLSDPTGPITGFYRVSRGGSWKDIPTYCQSTSRYGMFPGIRESYIGFRLCISADPEMNP
jgi:formylglycine-generating enzyme required for sulfatase activity